MRCKNKLSVSMVFPAIMLVLLLPAKNVQAAVLTVTTTEDNVAGSLRQAITMANNNGEDDTIHLPAGTYQLTGTAGDDANASGDLDIDTTHWITILGEGKNNTIIDGNKTDRVFHILNGTVVISGVTIRSGKTSSGKSGSANGENGGGIFNNGTLTLTNCTISNNRTGDAYPELRCDGGHGGGIYNNGNLTINQSVVNDNLTGNGSSTLYYLTSGSGSGGDGAGIYNRGVLTMKNSTVKKNTTGLGGNYFFYYYEPGHGGRGGGIYNEGTIYLTNCHIEDNTASETLGPDDDGTDAGNGGDGGGIYNAAGNIKIDRCRLEKNLTRNVGDEGGHGGGVYNCSSISVTDSTIEANYCTDKDYRRRTGCGGGIFNSGTIILSGSTITGNYTEVHSYAAENEEGCGGGIYNTGKQSLSNCTISNNQIRSQDIDIVPNGNGGGIFNSGTLELTSCTVCQNLIGSEGEEPEDFSWFGYGGGIYNAINGTLKARNTIIANNQSPALENGPDFWGELDSQGFNLIEDTNHCIIKGVVTGNISGVNPLLGLLANNGGLTYTHELLTNSPAIDAGNRSGLNTDQRGFTRPVDIPGISNVSDGSDIGAYELEIPIIPPRFYTISGKITENGTGFAGATLTFTGSDGSIVTCSTNEQGNYSQTVQEGWSGQVTPSKAGYTFSPSARNYTDINSNLPQQHFTAALIVPPWISLNRTQLNFGAQNQNPGYTSNKETFFIDNSGGSILTWSSSHEVNWISCNPLSGNNRGEVTVTVNATGLSPGIYTTVITVEAAEAVNTPQFVKVNLTVYDGSTLHPPFGCFATPLDHSTVSGSIPVTGWALDNIGIETVKIYSSGPGKDKKMTYIGDAIFVEGARPDVEERYYEYPGNFKAGWGYMMLTNFLANGGNGTYNIHAFAHDIEGNQVSLGTKTIICDNANAVKPFGAIDTPGQGGMASGRDFINFGWALTPLPNTILKDGSTITVWVDGKAVGQPVYNRYREDIATLFPGYNNSEGAVGYFPLDTTSYTNGVHTIQWTVTDDAGNTDGIGSRYFSIQNVGQQAIASCTEMIPDFSQIPVENFWPVSVKVGYNQDIEPQIIYPDNRGNITIEIKPLERLEFYFPVDSGEISQLSNGRKSFSSLNSGNRIISNPTPSYPIGATLDVKSGIFIWQPGIGYQGEFPLLFLVKDKTGYKVRKMVTVKIVPEGEIK